MLDRVVAVLAPRDISGIIVAIDELDKLADPAQAREFIDEIKGVFGVPHCLFLVSVSEDALTSFHRRGIPVRDAFDSAFTTVVRIEPFTLDEARVWLAKRAIGIPEPFVHLCYCLSGGLPRELRRIATTMYDHHIDTEKDDDLETVASSLVAADLAARLPAFTSTAAQLDDEQDPGTFLTNLAGPTCSDAWWLLKKCETILPRASDGAVTALTRLEWEAASYLYFCATVVEFFTNELQAQSVHTAVKDGSIVALAAARQQMALDPRVTWQLTTQFRQQRQFATIDECPNP
ncbi:hypothetical protein CFP75_31480 [Amycolatopsis alba DSM 44262]|uniref:KAP NTPase domain-containing protein n=1 Tax=Amycolatopsis alba DSM 44262 TaxID=1125972 RepID=A0A229RFL1_AMYAL|nr:hypothetical protein CFP75_31480 [Amycolatopsis alba DSM 44262]